MSEDLERGFDEVVLGRRSIRGFKPDPIPKPVIEEIVSLATRAPSSYNSQPWHVHIAAGDVLEAIRRDSTERTASGTAPSFERMESGAYEGDHRKRQIEVAVQLFEAMGIVRDDKAGRDNWTMRGFRIFDAPLLMVITYDKQLQGGDIAPFDCGALSNMLVNAAWSRGVGSVINSQGVMHSPVVREHLNIPEDQVILISIALGYPDESFPANAVVSKRRPVDDVATFLGFE
ncbi:nitroreductase [Congregibacter litoralis]|uniref:Nitroreductase n=1 Tax=Congregibacter litoralis KT71 TaxID=314285 RepID=A4A7B3_9GAMM|nr:nitroreductase [Congregibacter litoralis]EAQ98182.2 Nitroreductase [Congregibacter litoralis KT71]